MFELPLSILSAWGFVKKHALAFGLAAVALAVTAGGVYLYTHGRSAGRAAEQVQVEQRHTASVATARSDERTAQDAATRLGDAMAVARREQDTAAAASTKEISDGLKTLPVASGDIVVPASVRDASNAIVDRANRAATYAGPAD